VLKVKIN